MLRPFCDVCRFEITRPEIIQVTVTKDNSENYDYQSVSVMLCPGCYGDLTSEFAFLAVRELEP